MRFALALLMAIGLNGCATSSHNAERSVVEFSCDSIVVLGRLTDQIHIPTEQIDGELLSYSWFHANIDVQAVRRGELGGSKVSVRYFAHTYLRSDESFTFVLANKSEERWQLIDWRLGKNAKLARRCTNA